MTFLENLPSHDFIWVQTIIPSMIERKRQSYSSCERLQTGQARRYSKSHFLRSASGDFEVQQAWSSGYTGGGIGGRSTTTYHLYTNLCAFFRGKRKLLAESTIAIREEGVKIFQIFKNQGPLIFFKDFHHLK